MHYIALLLARSIGRKVLCIVEKKRTGLDMLVLGIRCAMHRHLCEQHGAVPGHHCKLFGAGRIDALPEMIVGPVVVHKGQNVVFRAHELQEAEHVIRYAIGCFRSDVAGSTVAVEDNAKPRHRVFFATPRLVNMSSANAAVPLLAVPHPVVAL